MIPAGFDYLRPVTVDEALLMAGRRHGAAFLAGGHALLPDLKLRRAGPSVLIDLGNIAGLRGVETVTDDERVSGGDGGPGRVVRIGAMTTSAEIEHSPAVAAAAPLLPLAAAVIADPLIRNRATLGGSLAEADPRGDWPPVILAAAATIHLRGQHGDRTLSADDFLTPGTAAPGSHATALRPGELITAIAVPVASSLTRFTYLKRMHLASGHAMLGVAIAATFDTGGTCRHCRIAITGTATAAVRAITAENRLTGTRLTAKTIKAAADAAPDGITFAGDAFGSAAYLGELLPVYVSQALTEVQAPSARA